MRKPWKMLTEAQKERRRESFKKYRQTPAAKAKQLERKRRWNAKNKDRKNAYNREWYARHKDDKIGDCVKLRKCRIESDDWCNSYEMAKWAKEVNA